MCMERQHEIRSRDRADDRLTQRSKRCKERQPCSLGMLSNGLCLVEASFRVSRDRDARFKATAIAHLTHQDLETMLLLLLVVME